MALIHTVQCLLFFIEYFVMSSTIESLLRLPILGKLFELNLTLLFIETKTKVKCCVTFKFVIYHLELCYDSTTYSCCDTWVGASDQVKEEVFQWTNKENVVFTNWKPYEPNDANGNEDCVSLCRDGQWNDNICNKTFNIICERYVFG